MTNIKNLGFSLVELSVVLVIIGLIIASIAGGSHLLYTAKLNNVISELRGYETAIDSFRNTHNYWPGDMPNAEDYWGTYHATNNPTGVNNGDGNEDVNSAPEKFQAWSHLSKAGLIKGDYDGTGSVNGDGVGGVNIPLSAGVDDLTYFINGTTTYDTTGLYIVAKKGGGFGGILKPEDVYYIDKKIDDGDSGITSAGTGSVFAIRGNSAGAGECVDKARTDSPPVEYILIDYEPNCRLIFWLEKD
jgi:prepilin-type N-terminal cleavage/methylation domain-containing protein